MGPPHALKVVVIGAGSTGLLLAQGLKQNGIECEVYEREDSNTYQTRPREWGMTLHWGASFISKCIPPELRPKLNDNICCDPFYGDKDLTLPHYNAQTGEKLFDMPGEEPRRISRKKLRNFLSQGVQVTYNKSLTHISSGPDNSMIATFSDGTTAQGSLIVGCDSANSVVRECLVGKDAATVEDLDIQMFNVSCSFSKETALLQRMGHPIFKNSYHPDGYMWWQSIQDVKDPDKPETWLFQNVLSWIGYPRAEDFPDRASRLKYWKEKAQNFAEPWKSVGRDLPEDLPIIVDRTTVWRPTMDWTEKFGHRVTLAGDAAHPMPPHRGQGLNNALQDASALVDELKAVPKGEKSLDDAVASYEKDMKERTLVEIPVSIAQAQMVHSFDTLMNAPFFKHGMNKYRAMKEASGQEIEVATTSPAQ